MKRIAPVVLLAAFVGFIVGCSKKEEAGFGSDKVDVSAQRAALKSPDPQARADACVELARAGEAAAPAVGDLVALLPDKSADVRRLAAYALFEIGPKAVSAAPALKEALGKERDQAVMMQMINTLRELDPKAAADLKTVNIMTP